MEYLLLIVGFILLIKGADFFVDGSSSVAKKLKIPSVVVGLTIVSLGTSAPEAAISIGASISGSGGISIGNIIGSNLFNLLMVIGMCALLKPFSTNINILKRDMIWNIAISIALFIVVLNGNISRIEGIIFLIAMISYMIIIVQNALKNRTQEENSKTLSTLKSIIFILGGIIAIILGGNLVVDNATIIAKQFGMSETLIGLTICAIGTSLPELVTSVVATKKGEPEIALGNAIGSCIFNILFILGATATISPMNINTEILIDIAILILSAILIFAFSFSKRKVSRIEGIICVLTYIIYCVYIILR